MPEAVIASTAPHPDRQGPIGEHSTTRTGPKWAGTRFVTRWTVRVSSPARLKMSSWDAPCPRVRLVETLHANARFEAGSRSTWQALRSTGSARRECSHCHGGTARARRSGADHGRGRPRVHQLGPE